MNTQTMKPTPSIQDQILDLEGKALKIQALISMHRKLKELGEAEEGLIAEKVSLTQQKSELEATLGLLPNAQVVAKTVPPRSTPPMVKPGRRLRTLPRATVRSSMRTALPGFSSG